jgi:transcriptional regulator
VQCTPLAANFRDNFNMYLPKHFSVSEHDEIFAFIDANAFGQLISIDEQRPFASHLPFLIANDRKTLLCHLARQNPQWRSLADQPVLITFLGPHDYISPSWYEAPGVPTWNYQAVHIYGHCRVFEAAAALANLVETLSERYESAFDNPWQPQYRDSMLQAIVGVEIDIDEIQCKYKLSQNRPKSDQQGVVDQLQQTGSKALAAAMRKTQDEDSNLR